MGMLSKNYTGEKLMESVHFYEKSAEKKVFEILKEDSFMRISHVVRESDVLHGGKRGCILYINASEDETVSIAQKLKDVGAEKITGEEEKTIMKTFKAEEENAASGIGLMFG